MLNRLKAGLAVSVVAAIATLALGATSASAAFSGTYNPVSHPFGSQIVSTESNTFNFTFTNTGDDILLINAAELTGSNPGQFKIKNASTCTEALELNVGVSCQVKVTFKPTALGAKTAKVSISSPMTTDPFEAAITGTSVADPTPKLYVSSPILTFGDQVLGMGPTSPSLATVLTNTGGGSLDMGAVGGTTGEESAGNGDFLVNAQDCAQRHLAAGESCALQTTFMPSAPGVRSAQMLIETNAGTQFVNLSGVGLA